MWCIEIIYFDTFSHSKLLNICVLNITNHVIVNVLHIEVTTIYDGASDATAALDLMKSTYSNSAWHYADPVTGENPG